MMREVLGRRNFRVCIGGALLVFCLLLAFLPGQTLARPEAPQSAAPPAAIRAVFPDNYLARAIAEELGDEWTLDSIVTRADLEELTELRIFGTSEEWIYSLEGIQRLTNLTYFRAEGHQISDLAPLAALDGLVTLNLRDNQISGLAPLSELDALERLILPYNQISDLTPLHDLEALWYLNLCNNQISDLSPLSAFPVSETETTLRLCCNQISDISPLRGRGLADTFLYNQKIVLAPIEWAETLTRPNVLRDFLGVMAPLAISNGGEFDAERGNIVWRGLPVEQTSVTYHFGPAPDYYIVSTRAPFSGTVVQPLNGQRPSPVPSPGPSPTPSPTPPESPIWREDLHLTRTHFAYLIGVGDARLNPLGHITRAEVATILLRVMSIESQREFWTEENTYTDVAGDAWYNNAVSTVTAAGLMQGVERVGTPRFHPHGNLTRAEVAVILARFLEMEEMTIPNVNFVDVSSDHWAYDSVNLVIALGWMQDINGAFHPGVPIPRGEFAVVMNRVLERTRADIDESDMTSWKDNMPSSPFFWDLQIASHSAPGTPAKNWEALQRPGAVPEDARRP